MAILLPTPHREERAPGRAEEDKRKKERKDTEQKICPLVVFGGRVGFLVC